MGRHLQLLSILICFSMCELYSVLADLLTNAVMGSGDFFVFARQSFAIFAVYLKGLERERKMAQFR